MKFSLALCFAGLLGLSLGSKFFSKETEEIDSSESGVVKGKKGTTCKCGWSNKLSKKIVGGKAATANEFPFLVSIAMDARANQFCGGAIISRYHVLTAHHCFWDYSRENITQKIIVIAGEHDTISRQHRKHTQVYNIVDWVPHPDFKKIPGFGPKNDLVILRLDREIAFNDKIGPVCLPNGPINLVNQYVTDMGWGLTSDGGSSSTVLLKVNERVTKLEHCWNEYPRITKDEPLLCTFAKGKSTCVGDSGGPIVWVDPETNMYTLVGVVSYGRICGGETPSVNADVTSYVDWIKKTVQDTMPSPTCSKV